MTSGQVAAAGAGVGGVLLIVGIVALVVLLMCGGLVAALLIPAVAKAREAAQRAQSANNMRQILIAMHNYNDTHGEFPPAFVPDENGKPKHSWRVLLLPYLEQQALFSRYDMSKPWDSPENLAVANNMPAVYRSPLEPEGNASNMTSYMLFAGDNTSFGKGKVTFNSLTDGTSNTIALSEVNDSGVVWTQPTDLDAAQLDFAIHQIAEQRQGQITSALAEGVTVGFFDGSVRMLSKQTPPGEIRSAVNPTDGRSPMLD